MAYITVVTTITKDIICGAWDGLLQGVNIIIFVVKVRTS